MHSDEIRPHHFQLIQESIDIVVATRVAND
jgi:hypothetical protein